LLRMVTASRRLRRGERPVHPTSSAPDGLFLDDGLLIVLACKAPTASVLVKNVTEVNMTSCASSLRSRRAAEAVDTLQLAAYLRFVVTLVVAGYGLRCPPAPYPRDHLPSLR